MTAYINQISSLGPKVWYRFNETAGTPVNYGSLSTTSTFTDLLLNEQTDVDGRAVYFNGSSSVLKLPEWPAFSLFDDRSFTTEMWFKIDYADTLTSSNPPVDGDKFRPLFLFLSQSGAQSIGAEIGTTNTGSRGKLIVANYIGTANIYTSTETYADNMWHHMVVVNNTTAFKVYVDGALKYNQSISASPTSIDMDNNTFYVNAGKLIGARAYDQGGDTIQPLSRFKGRIDEVAIYDRELTSAEVTANFVAGSSVTVQDTAGTASALMVQPTTSASFNPAAQAPMTASAASGDHYNSTVTFPTLLDSYMSTLSLQSWFKFDKNRVLTNYGTEPTRSSIWSSGATNNPTGGVQGSGELKLTISGGASPFITQQVAATTAEVALLNDEDFTIGFWTKKLTKETVGSFIISAYKSNNSEYITFKWNENGGISFNIHANNNGHLIESSTDITDGEWHFVVGKLSSNTMQLWVDGTSIGTTTMNHNYTLDYFNFDGSNSSDTTSVSQFFIATSAAIGTTQIANMWDYGTPSVLQGAAYMPEANAKFNSSFNDYIQSKNPVIDYRLDEAAGSPVNYGSASLALVPYLSPQGFTQGETGLNTRAFKFTSRDQTTRGNYAFETGTFSTDDLCTIGVLFKNADATNQQGFIGFGGRLTNPADGNGFSLQMLATSGYLRILAGNGNGTVTNYTGTTNYADNKWHLAVIVKSASTVKLYVDGKEHISGSCSTAMTDNGEFIIAGVAGIIASATARDTLIDEAFVTNTAFTAQEVFEAWQALRLEMDTTATALMVQPATDLGTGQIVAAAVATASGLLPMPTEDQVIAPTIDPMTATALFAHPNYGGNVVIDANYGTTSMTANAVFHDPQFNIGDGHSADHMNATGLMVHPISIAGGSISVNPGIALDATLVMPGIVTIKGARVSVDTMRSNAIFPLPPAYIQLSDDPWFVRLLQGHSDKKSEFIQGTLTNLPNQASTDIIGGGFLSFFDDVLNPITQSTNPNTISSEIPAYYFKPIEDLEFDTNGNLIALDTSKNVARVTPSRGVLTPTPIVSPGYFDNQQRKAVRISNIEIPLPGTSTNFSIRPYNLEFSFKATKQNQVLAYGQFTSPLYTNSRKVGAIGLYNGKIYLAEDFYTPVSAFGEVGIRSLKVAGSVPHPVNFTEDTYVGYMLGNKNVADGQWHHIVIQRGYTDNRTQIWIDGALDKQLGVQSNDGRSTGYANIPGSDASQEVRPYIIGFNSADTNLSSDFETSGWNYYPGRFLEEREVSLNNLAFIQAEPIKAEPMVATATATPNSKAAGNKARALLLYWWPVTRDGGSESIVSNDRGQFGPDDVPTFDTSVYTYDYENEIPQDYYGWDIFPVSVTGYAGDLGGSRSPFIKDSVLQSGGLYIDPVTSAPRYLDVFNDIDLSAFDAIFFRNFPDQAEERDSYIREEFSDEYFNLKEKELYSNFIASLRAAVDTGISLFITNSQLAIDLGIIEGYEIVPDLSSGTGDPYAPTILPGLALSETLGSYVDMHRNNRLRVVNTIDGLTNEAGYIWQDWAYFRGGAGSGVDPFSGEPNRPFISLLNKPNGLQVGDTFVISDATWQDSYFEAVPFNKVKAGKVITAFANTYINQTTVTDNPYKNYATSIALEPGTILNGTPTVGKIFVNFTERLDRTVGAVNPGLSFGRPSDGARDNFIVDLIQDEWINAAYDNGEISLAVRDAYLAAPFNLDRRLAAEIAGQNRPAVIAEIQKEKYWDSNGLLILTQKSSIEDPTGALYDEAGDQTTGSGSSFGRGNRRVRINKVRKDGTPSTGTVTSALPWFTLTYSYQYIRVAIQVPSMLTRGFRWLSNKIVDEGRVVRTEAASAIAAMPNHVGVGNKPVTVNAQAMLSLATIVHAPIYSLSSVLINTLPLTAVATFGQFARNIRADVLAGSALFRDPRILSIEEDEVVLYIYHVDPILYLREDVIK